MSTAAARPTPVAASGSAGRASRALAARLGTVVLTLAIVLALWHLLTAVTGIISPARFPTPAEVGSALQQIAIDGYSNGRLHEHVLRSVLLVTMGFAVAVIDRRRAGPGDGCEPRGRGLRQPDLPGAAADSAAGLDPAGHRLAGPG